MEPPLRSSSLQPQQGVSTGDLAAARLIRAATIAARTAGSIDGPLPLLTDSALDAPITEIGAEPWEGEWPSIRGYQIESELGSGGQACVYRGVQESTGRSVAIKVIPGGPFVNSRRRARFDREAKLLAGFDHPNIVSILDRGRTQDGSFFIAMDLIQGVALDQYWPQLDGQPEALARLFVKIAAAVDEAHQRGIVHRDLKPSNIRVDQRGEPHILDFGLASLTESNLDDSMQISITDSGQMVGSLPWSSPEQCANRDDAADCRSDVYSMGIMLYQAIAGRFPYKIDGSLGDTLKNIATAFPIAPSTARLNRSESDFRALDGITLKCLAKNPAERYSSGGALADDLRNYLHGRPTGKPRRNHRRLFYVQYGLLLILLCGILGLAGERGFRASPTVATGADLRSLLDSSGLSFVRVPAGTSVLGSTGAEEGRRVDEARRFVTFQKPFWISTTCVTQRVFKLYMGFNPSDPRYLGELLPVQRVTWGEAQEFCHRLAAKSHRPFRLPTEAEWEYACRANQIGPFGDGCALNDVGWWAGNSGHTLHAVATKAPNFWGIYDMHGGVFEWCFDLYQAHPSSGTPIDETAGPTAGRVIRGGSFLSDESDCRAAARSKASPQTRSCDRGFRIAFDDLATHSTDR